MSGPPTLTCDGIILDGLRPEDASAMVAADDDATRRAWARDQPLTLATARWLVDQASAGWADGSGYWFAIREAGSRGYIGQLELWPARAGLGGHVGVIVAPTHRRAGHARRALRCGSRYAFGVLGWPFLVADIEPDNIASHKLVESVGFRRMPDQTGAGPSVWVYVLHRGGEAISHEGTRQTPGS